MGQGKSSKYTSNKLVSRLVLISFFYTRRWIITDSWAGWLSELCALFTAIQAHKRFSHRFEPFYPGCLVVFFLCLHSNRKWRCARQLYSRLIPLWYLLSIIIVYTLGLQLWLPEYYYKPANHYHKSWPILAADILTCHSKKKAKAINNNTVAKFWQWDTKPVFAIPGNRGSSKKFGIYSISVPPSLFATAFFFCSNMSMEGDVPVSCMFSKKFFFLFHRNCK